MSTPQEREASYERHDIFVPIVIRRVTHANENLARVSEYRTHHGDLLASLLKIELVDAYRVGPD